MARKGKRQRGDAENAEETQRSAEKNRKKKWRVASGEKKAKKRRDAVRLGGRTLPKQGTSFEGKRSFAEVLQLEMAHYDFDTVSGAQTFRQLLGQIH